MRFSFIIPTYNSVSYIRQCLDAIYAVDYDGSLYEVLVVDGGSTDSTLHIIDEFPGTVILHSENISIANSRNIGAQSAHGQYLAFIDSDCVVTPELLKNAEVCLQEYECCGSFYKPSADHGWVARDWLLVERKEDGIVDWLTSGTLLVRKEIFEAIGGFNEKLQTEEDEDFARRIRGYGGRLVNDSSMASVHLGQPDTLYDFFCKEMWRGKSLLKSFSLKKNRDGALSVFNLVMLAYLVNFLVFFVSGVTGNFLVFLLAAGGIFALPFLLALRKVSQSGKWRHLFGVYVLSLLFFWARILSVFRYNQFKYLL